MKGGVPRSGWLALGSVVAALAGPPAIDRFGPVSLLLAGMAVVLAAFILAIARRRTSPTWRQRPIAPLAAGVALVALRLALNGPALAPTSIPSGDGPWAASVVGIGSPRDGEQTATLALEPSGLRVAATVPRYPELATGDRVSTSGRLEPLPSDDGGYGTYLRRIGVTATLRGRSLDRLAGDGSPAGVVESLRRSSGDALTRSLPEPEAGLAAGILIGLRDRVDRDLAAAFTTAGVSHVVAISGWNIAIVAAVAAGLLRGRLGRRGRSVVTLGAIVAYTVAAGGSPSVVRAAVMAAVVLLARESGRAGAAATALGWAVVLLLLVDPGMVADPGFQLSVLATAGLIAWATRVTDRLRSWHGGMLPGWLAESLGISFAAEAATLPVVLAGFGRFAVLAPVVNLLVVPLVPPAMAAGTVALVGGWLAQAGAPAIVATIVGLPGWLALAAMVAVVRGAASLPFANVNLPPPWGVVAGLGAAAAVVVVASGRLNRPRVRRVRSRRRPSSASSRPTGGRRASPRIGRPPASRGRVSRSARAMAGVVALCLVAVVLVAANRPDGRVRVTVLDVGQGDAILVEGGLGGRLLVDGGPDPERLLVALDARLPPWDRRIDLLVLTHPHEDHVAGLALLLSRYRVGRTFEPGMIGPGPGYRAWEAALERLHLQPARLATGDRFSVDQVRFRVLWPDPGAVPRQPADGGTAINNVSIVLLGEVGRERFLLAGDIEEGIDPILVARGLPRVDLLKIAHHGSRTSSTGPFLDAVRPRVAVASAGKGNPYGHPTKATLDRVAARGAQVLRTDRNGSVEVTLDGAKELDVRPERSDVADAADGSSTADVRPTTGGLPATTAAGGLAAATAAGARVAATVLARPVAGFSCAIPVSTG
jgi:competence protein ComEC